MMGKVKGALKCPFCGTLPRIEPWPGGGPNKHMIGCNSLRCYVGPFVTGESPEEAIKKWNSRK